MTDWLNACRTASSRAEVRSAFKLLYRAINDRLEKSDHTGVAKLLKDLVGIGMPLHPTLLISGLRLTCLHHDQIESWTVMVERASTLLEKQGHDPSVLLQGLVTRR